MNVKPYTIKFAIGETVYLKTDIEQHARFVTGINIRECGIMYCLMFINIESWHYAFELTSERDIVKATS